MGFSLRNNLPNILTLLNLLFGVLAIMIGDYQLVPYFFLGSLVADVFDGLLARKLGVSGELGAQLDSLADLISFGMLPAYFIFKIYQPHVGSIAYLSSLIVVFACIRLAVFNISEPSKYFYGLPSPAAAIFGVIPVIIAIYSPQYFDRYLANLAILLLLIIFICGSMVSKLKLVSLKGTKKQIIYLSTFVLFFIGLGFISPVFWLIIIPIYFISGLFTS